MNNMEVNIINYEDLYLQVQGLQKETKDLLSNSQKGFKNLCKDTENGDLKSFTKDISLLENLSKDYSIVLTKMRETVENFDTREYIENGDFAQQMVDCCNEMEVDIKGEFLTYEIFPYKIKIDPESLDIIVDRKKVSSFRPLSFVSNIKVSINKLLKAPFNPTAFANELASAYDLALLKQSRGKSYSADSDYYLTSLYKNLTPMKRFRKDYDIQSFSFDLARLYSSDVSTIDDGRSFQFGPSRNINKAIRVLDKDGHEQFLATIRFY